MPSVSTKSSGSKNHAAQKNKKPIRHHVKASIEDINWVRSQLPCVQQLWLDCVAAEQFGTQERALNTQLSKNAFNKAKLALEQKGLFKFEPIYKRSPSGRSELSGWKVRNFHGYRIKSYWEIDNHEMTTDSQEMIADNHEMTADNHEMIPDNHSEGDETTETIAQKELLANQQSSNQVLTPSQPITKVEKELMDTVAITQPPFEEVAAMATDDIDQEEKPADITGSRVTENITPPLAQPDVVPLNVSVSPVDVEEIRRRTREKLQALNPRGGARERRVYIGQFMRSH